MTKQCVCGRSKNYPICDGSHKITQYEQLRKEIEDILFDLGKNIKLLTIDKDNTALDIPYKQYVDELLMIFINHKK